MTNSYLRTSLMIVIRSRQANPKWGDIFITLEHTLICKYLGQTMVFYAEEKRKDIDNCRNYLEIIENTQLQFEGVLGFLHIL